MSKVKMRLIFLTDTNFSDKGYWRYAVVTGKDDEGLESWFPLPEIFSTKEQAIKEAPECYPKRELVGIDDPERITI